MTNPRHAALRLLEAWAWLKWLAIIGSVAIVLAVCAGVWGVVVWSCGAD